MTFRGVKLIKPIRVDISFTGKTEVYFDNIIDHPTRERWLAAGYPVYYDHISNKSYIIVDRNTKFDDTDQVDTNCVCGSKAVGSTKHSYYCGAT